MTDTTLLTLTEAKRFLGIDGTQSDVDLQSMLNAVARVLEHRVGPIDPVTYTKVIEGSGEDELSFPHQYITAISSVEFVDSSAAFSLDVSAGNLIIDATAGIVYLKSGVWPDEEMAITYTVGRTAPANVKEAAKIVLQQAWAPYRGAGRPGKGPQAPQDQTPSAILIPWRAELLLAPDSIPLGFA